MRLFVAGYPSSEALADLDATLAPVRPQWPELRWAPPEQWHLTLAFYGEVDVARVDELTERLQRAAARCRPLPLALTAFGAFPSARLARVCWFALDGATRGAAADDASTDGAATTDGAPADAAASDRGTADAPPHDGATAGDVSQDRTTGGDVSQDRTTGGDATGAASAAGVAGVVDPVEELRRLAARCEAAGRRIGVSGDAKPYRPHLTVARPRRAPLDVGPLVEVLARHVGPAWTARELRLVRSHLGPQVRHEALAALPLGTRGATPGGAASGLS